MCGILAIFRSTLSEPELRKKLIECSSKLRHRGPDWSGYVVDGNNGIAHERLAIINPESGAQPLTSVDKQIVVAANGEIYNYKSLFARMNYTPLTGSDCEVVIPLYLQEGLDHFAKLLRGMFSFVIYDKRDQSFAVVRDHVGITPLYIGYGADGSVWFASEMKALSQECTRFQQFPPGHYYDSQSNTFTAYYAPLWKQVDGPLPTTPFDAKKLRDAFETAVKSHIMSDVPWGVLLSGGLDSSLVAAVASRLLKRKVATDTHDHLNWYPQLHSFCIGLEHSPDLLAAQKVADYLGTVHHSYTYTIQEGLDAIRPVIYHLETFDVTTVRAATPMFLMARKIKAMGIKMVLSGEGSDEIFAGYLYFHKAPNARELQEELRDKLSQLYLFDCLRANKATSAWGVEARVPFLDQDFLEVAMSINPEEKLIRLPERMEKYLLRQAFDTPEDPYLPREILWRQKEQFSDGVGYGWIDSLRALAEESVTDQMFTNASNRFPENPPLTKEAYLYRAIFEEHYPQLAAVKTVPGGPSIACSTARAMAWDESFQGRADCSGRAVVGVHEKAYDQSFTVPSVVVSSDGNEHQMDRNGGVMKDEEELPVSKRQKVN